LAVLLGALVPLASIPMAAILLVATFTVHLPYGFSSIKLQAVTAAGAQFGPPGFETDLLYLASLAALVLAGSGPLAIDSLLAKRREHMCPSSRAEPSAGCRGATGTDEATALSGRGAHGSAWHECGLWLLAVRRQRIGRNARDGEQHLHRAGRNDFWLGAALCNKRFRLRRPRGGALSAVSRPGAGN